MLFICQALGRLAIARVGNAKWTLLDANAPERCWVDTVRIVLGSFLALREWRLQRLDKAEVSSSTPLT